MSEAALKGTGAICKLWGMLGGSAKHLFHAELQSLTEGNLVEVACHLRWGEVCTSQEDISSSSAVPPCTTRCDKTKRKNRSLTLSIHEAFKSQKHSNMIEIIFFKRDKGDRTLGRKEICHLFTPSCSLILVQVTSPLPAAAAIAAPQGSLLLPHPSDLLSIEQQSDPFKGIFISYPCSSKSL